MEGQPDPPQSPPLAHGLISQYPVQVKQEKYVVGEVLNVRRVRIEGVE